MSVVYVCLGCTRNIASIFRARTRSDVALRSEYSSLSALSFQAGLVQYTYLQQPDLGINAVAGLGLAMTRMRGSDRKEGRGY